MSCQPAPQVTPVSSQCRWLFRFPHTGTPSRRHQTITPRVRSLLLPHITLCSKSVSHGVGGTNPVLPTGDFFTGNPSVSAPHLLGTPELCSFTLRRLLSDRSLTWRRLLQSLLPPTRWTPPRASVSPTGLCPHQLPN